MIASIIVSYEWLSQYVISPRGALGSAKSLAADYTIVASAKENHRYQYLMSDFALAGLLRANAGHSEGRPACPTKLLDIPNLIFPGLQSQSFERNSELSYHVHRDDPF